MSAQASITRDTLLGASKPESEAAPTVDVAGAFEHVRDRAGNLYRRVKESAIEKEHAFEGRVKEHPVRSVLVAAGVGAGIGLLAGYLLSRR